MDPMPKRPPETAAHPKGWRRAEQQKSGGHAMAESGVSYVRLRLHNEAGKLSIVGAKEVPGPLTVPDYVGTGLVYEVLADNRRIGLGSLPDPNGQRAFTNFDQPEAALGHNPTALKSYDFDVRVPSTELSAETLTNTSIQLHEVGAAPSERLAPQALAVQLGDAVRTLATLDSIKLNDMESSARGELASILETHPTI